MLPAYTESFQHKPKEVEISCPYLEQKYQELTFTRSFSLNFIFKKIKKSIYDTWGQMPHDLSIIEGVSKHFCNNQNNRKLTILEDLLENYKCSKFLVSVSWLS